MFGDAELDVVAVEYGIPAFQLWRIVMADDVNSRQ